LLLYMLSQE